MLTKTIIFIGGVAMGLFKAFRNYALRRGNDAAYHSDIDKAKKEAYAETGKKIAYAKRKGYQIDGSATYKRAYNAKAQKAKERYSARDKFISDL